MYPYKVSFIIPCFNESGNINRIYEKIGGSFKDCPFQIVFVDDGSKDSTFQEIKDLEKELRNLQDYRNNQSWWMIWDYLPDEFEKWNTETFVSVKNDPRNLLRILEENLDTYVPILDELSKKL